MYIYIVIYIETCGVIIPGGRTAATSDNLGVPMIGNVWCIEVVGATGESPFPFPSVSYILQQGLSQLHFISVTPMIRIIPYKYYINIVIKLYTYS